MNLIGRVVVCCVCCEFDRDLIGRVVVCCKREG